MKNGYYYIQLLKNTEYTTDPDFANNNWSIDAGDIVIASVDFEDSGWVFCDISKPESPRCACEIRVSAYKDENDTFVILGKVPTYAEMRDLHSKLLATQHELMQATPLDVAA
jgi:hypothetical protein